MCALCIEFFCLFSMAIFTLDKKCCNNATGTKTPWLIYQTTNLLSHLISGQEKCNANFCYFIAGIFVPLRQHKLVSQTYQVMYKLTCKTIRYFNKNFYDLPCTLFNFQEIFQSLPHSNPTQFTTPLQSS